MSKIMNLKFMQRRKSLGGSSTPGESKTPEPTADVQGEATRPTNAAETLALEQQWSLETGSPAVASPANTDMGEEARALLRFQPGRRSFGGANPRLEKRLAEVEQQKVQCKADIEAAKTAAREESERIAEREALLRRAAEHEAKEREISISEKEMAQHYAKYLKPSGLAGTSAPKLPSAHAASATPDATASPAFAPPEVSNPVKVTDAPQSKLAAAGSNPRKRKTDKGPYANLAPYNSR